MTPSRSWRVLRVVLLVPFAIFFFGPLLAMFDFSTQSLTGNGHTLRAWHNLVSYQPLYSALSVSLGLALFTVLLMLGLLVPTMIWVRLRATWARRIIEFVCLLPLTIPALVIVVGLKWIYSWVNYIAGDSTLVLTFVYVVLVLPYAYRAIDGALSGIDVVTLAEASRSLGASWRTTVLRIIVPNIWSGILAAAFISVSVVLGEYTIASLTGYTNLQVAIVALGKTDGPTAVAASLGVLLFVFVLLLLLSVLAGRRRGARISGIATATPVAVTSPSISGSPQ